MKRRDFALTAALSPLLMTACGGGGGEGGVEFSGAKAEAAAGLKRAAQYMDEVVSYQGGYVWSYSPDLKQTFGEMEAYRTMCWIQPPARPRWAMCTWTHTTPRETSATTRQPSAPPWPS